MKKLFIVLVVLILAVLTIAACGGGGEDKASESAAESAATLPPGDAANGEKLFNQTCQACHGAGGIGIEGLGKDMTTSEFISGQSDAELLAFIKKGRPSGDSMNTTGVDMPPKGGNPALTDEQIMDIIAYIRTLQK